MHPTTQRKPYYSNESPNVKTKAEQSFCYAPNEGSGCILSKRFSGGFLLRHGRRRKKEWIIHNPGCICRFALGFCNYKKERTETLYQSFSPFMVEVTGFEPATFWSRKLTNFDLLSTIIQFCPIATGFVRTGKRILLWDTGCKKLDWPLCLPQSV